MDPNAKVNKGPQNDLYSLGLILYSVISGIQPESRPPNFKEHFWYQRGVSYEMRKLIFELLETDSKKSALDFIKVCTELAKKKQPKPITGTFLLPADTPMANLYQHSIAMRVMAIVNKMFKNKARK